jgi:Mce-associated membrane protein
MAAVFGALAVVAVVALVLELLVLRPRYEAVQADKQARADVTRVAQRFTAEVNNYNVSTIDSYQKHIGPMLSTNFRGQFEKAMQNIVVSVKQAKMNSHGQVLASAVSSLDPDSAKVLVVADANVRTVFDTKQRHFRWEVDLVQVDGRWLVNDFTPVD